MAVFWPSRRNNERCHRATSPYPIKPADVSRPWHAFRRDVLDRHTDPVPAVDPDNPAAYRAELAATRHAVAAGAATATTYRELTGGPHPDVAARLAALTGICTAATASCAPATTAVHPRLPVR